MNAATTLNDYVRITTDSNAFYILPLKTSTFSVSGIDDSMRDTSNATWGYTKFYAKLYDGSTLIWNNGSYGTEVRITNGTDIVYLASGWTYNEYRWTPIPIYNQGSETALYDSGNVCTIPKSQLQNGKKYRLETYFINTSVTSDDLWLFEGRTEICSYTISVNSQPVISLNLPTQNGTLTMIINSERKDA